MHTEHSIDRPEWPDRPERPGRPDCSCGSNRVDHGGVQSAEEADGVEGEVVERGLSMRMVVGRSHVVGVCCHINDAFSI